LKLPPYKIYFFDLHSFADVAGKMSTATSAKNLTFCLLHQQKGVNKKKITEGNLKKKL
jgi:hypothetical protein